MKMLRDLMSSLPAGARVLDAGCGAGVPVAQALSEQFNVTGIDISSTQIDLARQLVPRASFMIGDIGAIDLPGTTFDAICSFFAIIHVPREEHRSILRGFHRLLAPDGLLLLSTGSSDNPDDVENNWLDAGAPMYWSHYDRDTNLRMIAEEGFSIIDQRTIQEDPEFGGGSHLFVLAQARGRPTGK
jgi:SAM-dependent methyltransferase